MNLLEHEAKRLIAQSGIAVPKGVVVGKNDNVAWNGLCVAKSQVPTGGRGKAGGILLCENATDARDATEKLFALNIKGYTPNTVLVEEKLAISRELYLSVLVNRETKSLEVMAHTEGGVEVEDNDSSSYLRLNVSEFTTEHGVNIEAIGDALADHYDLADKTFVLQDMVENLLGCMRTNDATMIEVNPLVVTAGGNLIAGDCKMTLDDAAAFRHTEWSFEAETHNANFVTLDKNGTVATIANGAGLAMATVDAVTQTGLTPANFLDIGGGANEASVTAAFEKILDYDNIQAILINIFAGITRCDEVARAIIAATNSFDRLPPLFIRLEGTNAEPAQALLADAQIRTYTSLTSALDGLVDLQSVAHNE